MIDPQDLHDQHWVSDLYCPTYAIGHCLTYNPPEDGLPRFDGGIGLFLGHKNKDHTDLHQHQIYLSMNGDNSDQTITFPACTDENRDLDLRPTHVVRSIFNSNQFVQEWDH